MASATESPPRLAPERAFLVGGRPALVSSHRLALGAAQDAPVARPTSRRRPARSL